MNVDWVTECVCVLFCLSAMTLTDGEVGGGSGISHLSLCVKETSCVERTVVFEALVVLV